MTFQFVFVVLFSFFIDINMTLPCATNDWIVYEYCKHVGFNLLDKYEFIEFQVVQCLYQHLVENIQLLWPMLVKPSNDKSIESNMFGQIWTTSQKIASNSQCQTTLLSHVINKLRRIVSREGSRTKNPKKYRMELAWTYKLVSSLHIKWNNFLWWPTVTSAEPWNDWTKCVVYSINIYIENYRCLKMAKVITLFHQLHREWKARTSWLLREKHYACFRSQMYYITYNSRA